MLNLMGNCALSWFACSGNETMDAEESILEELFRHHIETTLTRRGYPDNPDQVHFDDDSYVDRISITRATLICP
jgi:hypothetical protein